jgi:mercuric ion transport protein
LGRGLIAGGIIGSIVAALCCLTPILVVLLGAVGLSEWLGYADYVVMPALVFFVLLTAYGVYRQRRDAACARGSKSNLSRD